MAGLVRMVYYWRLFLLWGFRISLVSARASRIIESTDISSLNHPLCPRTRSADAQARVLVSFVSRAFLGATIDDEPLEKGASDVLPFPDQPSHLHRPRVVIPE